jgi:hypothetical protein
MTMRRVCGNASQNLMVELGRVIWESIVVGVTVEQKAKYDRQMGRVTGSTLIDVIMTISR